MKGELRALSIRQPFAWLVVQGIKPFENRDWSPLNPAMGWVHRGTKILIHAGKGMKHAEYEMAHSMAEERGVVLPAFHDLDRGGIVGVAEIVKWHYDKPEMPWAFGPGIELTNVHPVTFAPCPGALGFFRPRGFAIDVGARLVRELEKLGVM